VAAAPPPTSPIFLASGGAIFINGTHVYVDNCFVAV
jgi:hypothetical protein